MACNGTNEFAESAICNAGGVMQHVNRNVFWIEESEESVKNQWGFSR